MQIVIDISENTYNLITRGDENRDFVYKSDLMHAIENGVPLPKGHGRLIDADRFDAISYQHTSDDFDNGVMWLAEQIDNAPTIIKADIESKENEIRS